MKNNLRYWALISILVLLLPFLIGDASAATWYNSSWLKARQITIDQTDIDTADLTNYPLYVNMTLVNVGTDSQADCDDFVFTDSTNVTKLDHEIETCDDANNWAEFWVEVPTVDFDADTILFMYYDNAGATDQQNTQGTWNSDYQAVWHLNGTFIDSTSSPITCTNTGTSAASDVYIGDSRTWDGVDDIIDCGSAAKIDNIFDGGGTISGWIMANTDGEIGAVILEKSSATTGWRFNLISDTTLPTELTFRIRTTDTVWTTNTEIIDTNIWYHVAVVYNDDASTNDPLIYFNGASQAITQTGVDTAYGSDDTRNLCIGNINNCASTRTWDGGIDDVRLNDSVLAAGWVNADYQCQRGAVDGNSCITVGDEGAEAGGVDHPQSYADTLALTDTLIFLS